jgi:spore maturation protein CgeB
MVTKLQMAQLEDTIKRFKPDLVVFVGIFFIPIQLVQVCKENQLITAGWAGDAFGELQSSYSDFLDFLYVSDSALLSIANKIGFKNVELLQFGYNPQLHYDYNKTRTNYINFIGSYTKQRDEIFSYLKDYNLRIEGVNWDKLVSSSNKWIVNNQKLDQKKVVDIYNSTIATLNVAQKDNVINMVNMRTFEAIASGSCMLNDYVKDIELCFEPNKEILVYKNKDELLELAHKILNDKDYARNIAKNGINRIQKDGYSYKHRTKTMIDSIN